MELSAVTLINVQALLISISIVALSITNYYFVGHALRTFAIYFSAPSYKWVVPGGPFVWPPEDGHRVKLTYDKSPETMILVSTSLSIVAGFFGIAAFFFSNKNRKMYLMWTYSTLGAAIAAFISSFVSIIVTSFKYEHLANTKCRFGEGREGITNPKLHCTRELLACEMVNFITDTNWADNRRACRETKGARVVLVPLTVLTFVMIVLYGLKIWLMPKSVKKVDDNAEERVERLQGDE